MSTPLLTVDNVQICRILERLNRFVVSVEIEEKIHLAHINKTGRLRMFCPGFTEGST